LLIHRGFTGHACRPHEKSGLGSYQNLLPPQMVRLLQGSACQQ